MIAIQLHYLYKISGVTVLDHKRSTLHSIFQISISQNMKCAQMDGLPKYNHIYTSPSDFFSLLIHSCLISCHFGNHSQSLLLLFNILHKVVHKQYSTIITHLTKSIIFIIISIHPFLLDAWVLAFKQLLTLLS